PPRSRVEVQEVELVLLVAAVIRDVEQFSMAGPHREVVDDATRVGERGDLERLGLEVAEPRLPDAAAVRAERHPAPAVVEDRRIAALDADEVLEVEGGTRVGHGYL